MTFALKSRYESTNWTITQIYQRIATLLFLYELVHDSNSIVHPDSVNIDKKNQFFDATRLHMSKMQIE